MNYLVGMNFLTHDNVACHTLNQCLEIISSSFQLRLDFTTFVITGPSTSSATATEIINGQPAAGGVAVATRGQCLTDTFSVTNPGGLTPPVICGTNSGDHSEC